MFQDLPKLCNERGEFIHSLRETYGFYSEFSEIFRGYNDGVMSSALSIANAHLWSLRDLDLLNDVQLEILFESGLSLQTSGQIAKICYLHELNEDELKSLIREVSDEPEFPLSVISRYSTGREQDPLRDMINAAIEEDYFEALFKFRMQMLDCKNYEQIRERFDREKALRETTILNTCKTGRRFHNKEKPPTESQIINFITPVWRENMDRWFTSDQLKESCPNTITAMEIWYDSVA